MRLCLVISSLAPGGAERVLTTMANHWSARGHEVTLITLGSSEDDFYFVDSRIARVTLDLLTPSSSPLQAIVRNMRRIHALRRAIGRVAPDVVISFLDQTNILTLLATSGMRFPVAVSERIDPSVQPLEPIWRALRTIMYFTASRIVVQTERAAAYFGEQMRPRISVIPNPVLKREGESNVCLPKPCVLGVGRLVHQKGFDLLLRAFAGVSNRHPAWNLVVIGDGTARDGLQRLAADLRLSDKVYFLGRVDINDAVMRQADLFVLSSRFEGFPNALCEAMVAERPVISFDCPSGPSEIIRDGQNGVLLPPEDVPRLSRALDRMMSDGPLRERLGRQAATITGRYGVESVMKTWDRLLAELVRSTSLSATIR